MNIRGSMEFVHCCCFMLFGLLHQAEPQKTKPDEIQALAWNLGARGTTQGVDIKKENYDKTGAATMTISRQEAMSGLLAPSASRIGLKAWKRNMESDSWHKSRMKQPCQRNLASGHGRKGAHKKRVKGKCIRLNHVF